MKEEVYELVVDIWRLASKYGFRKMSDAEWEAFVIGGERLSKKYRVKGGSVERLCRDLFAAFQDFHQRKSA